MMMMMITYHIYNGGEKYIALLHLK